MQQPWLACPVKLILEKDGKPSLLLAEAEGLLRGLDLAMYELRKLKEAGRAMSPGVRMLLVDVRDDKVYDETGVLLTEQPRWRG